MAKTFGKHERLILNAFKPEKIFTYKNSKYKILLSGKPTCSKGEPKTDIYVKCKNIKNDFFKEFKISFKKKNADFLENKMSARRAEQLFGDDWKDIIYNSILKIKENFKKKKLVYKKRDWPTRKGSITLGWKFELLNVKSGFLAGELNLDKAQLLDVYAGNNLSKDKKDASVCGKVIENSGIANYIIEYTPVKTDNLNEIISQMVPIEKYVEKNPDVFFACKALNYRSFKDKYDGNRPLAVYVDWMVKNNKLTPKLVFDEPLIRRGNYVANKLKEALRKLNIETTDDINSDNISSAKVIH